MKETWVIFFILGIIMLDYPFMDIFNKRTKILGLPLLYLYIFVGWAISIFVIYLFTKSIRPDDEKENGADRS
jgi:Na+-driven multidrug efflux pump